MKAFGITDKGTVRGDNQDCFLLQLNEEQDSAAAVICDGMGGVKGGALASALASDAFMGYVTDGMEHVPEPDLALLAREAAAYANLKVFDRAWRDVSYRGMGTTLVSVLVRRGETVVVNVGDSRCYWIADGNIQQITRDHSLVQEMSDQGLLSGEDTGSHPRKNVITRAVGTERFTRSDVYRIDCPAGDALLLCSDGLSNVVSEDEILRAFCAHTDPESVCRALLSLATERGAPDNVTILLLVR